MSIIYTSNTTDVAVKGEGFFMVEDLNSSEIFYTRKGDFVVSNVNELMTKNGHFVLDVNKKPISYFDQNDLEKIAIAIFEKPETLIRHSSGYFTAPSSSAIQYNTSNEIFKHSLEVDHVDLAGEFLEILVKQKQALNKKIGHLKYVKVTSFSKKMKFICKLPLFIAGRMIFVFPFLVALEISHESIFPNEVQASKSEIIVGIFKHLMKSSYNDLYSKTFYLRENPDDPAWTIYDLRDETSNPFKRFGWF